MIELLPQSVPVTGLKNDFGQYVLVNSLDHVFAEMQLQNAKHPEGKTEYDEILAYLRRTICKAVWQ